MSTELDELAARLHDRAQRAASEAQAIEDPSTQRAITELATGLREIARHLRDSQR